MDPEGLWDKIKSEHQDKLHELMEMQKRWVDHFVGEGNDSIIPSLAVLSHNIAQDREQLQMIVIADGLGGSNKHEIMKAIGRKIYEDQLFPIAVVAISEAWYSRMRPGYQGEILPPSQDPARQSCLMVVGMSVKRKIGFAKADVWHDEKGNMQKGEWVEGENGETHLLASFYDGFFEHTKKLMSEQN